MSWDRQTKSFANRKEIQKYFDNYFQPISSGLVGNVYYAASNKFWKSGLLVEGEKVFCWIVLFRYSQKGTYNFAYKVMDSSMNPFYYDVPASVLKLLSSPVTEDEKAWFVAVEENKKRKKNAGTVKALLQAGKRIIFKEPLKFASGVRLTTFTYEGGNIFVNGNDRYRIPKWQKRDFEITE